MALESSRAASTGEQAFRAAMQHFVAGRLAEAAACCERLIADDDAGADPFHLLGLISMQRGEVGRAVGLIEHALELSPSNAVFLSNLADAYHRLNCPDRARECSEEAVALQPGLAAARVNLGNALAALGELDAAERSYQAAIAQDPHLPVSRVNLGLLKLLRGDYAAGLNLYEARLEPADAAGGDSHTLLAKVRGIARWRGESLQGKRVLVWTEQGLGDSIMTMRYLPPLKALGVARLEVCCEPALARLMQRLPEVDRVTSDIDDTGWLERFDFHCPMMSLPFGFGTRLETIPAPIPYVTVPLELTQKWSAKVSLLPSPRVGIVWAGGTQTLSDPRRSIPLESFLPVLKKRGLTVVSLQKGPEAGQVDRIAAKPVDWMDECSDLLETAALVEQLDLVVSVDTSVAHLAGALGKRVWLLNRTGSEWRWLLDRSDSPWYPTMRVFRQTQAGWDAVIRDVMEALNCEPALHRSASPAGWLRRLWERRGRQ